jgi:hypothetical protein
LIVIVFSLPFGGENTGIRGGRSNASGGASPKLSSRRSRAKPTRESRSMAISGRGFGEP